MNNELHNKTYLKGYRKRLRKDLTKAEAFLWKQLKNSQFQDKKFRRQHSIGPFIVDFYYPEEKLGIELDGSVHDNIISAEYDDNRTEYMKANGIRVIRFENKELFENFDSVMEAIRQTFNTL
ncbi:MAG: endonuclease domain-containing protein [Sphingobacteriales bacterium JAD_PAG50586_3]|nr:MAG: endonuclease domain-containing protein [Sphingobacteriales bacterium JAD_PAG50586_3]